MSVMIMDIDTFLSLSKIRLNNSFNIDRIEFIGAKNPEWAVKLTQFMEMYPEFKRFRNIAPLDGYRTLTGEDWLPKTIFETVIYYACCAGVRYDYAIGQFKKIVSFLRSKDWISLNASLYNFLLSSSIQQKKQRVYWDIFCWMARHGITNETLTIDSALALKNDIVGLGDGYLAFMKLLYTSDDDCVQYTDIKFIKGFEKVYGKSKKSYIKEMAKKYIASGFGRVADVFMSQICYYG